MGELTRIYSCGKSMTTVELLKSMNTLVDPQDVDVWFPEVNETDCSVIPLTEREIHSKLPQLIGKTIVTVNEIVILMMLREVRKGRMRTDELELWCGDRRIPIDVKGEIIDDWDGGFFELSFDLRFN